SRLAWYITIFLGLQSFVFYALITWLPDILQLHGYSAEAVGWMLFLMQFALIPVTFVIPVVAEKMDNQVLLSGLTGTFFIVGIIGILSGHQFDIQIATMKLEMARGSAYSLCMMFFSVMTGNGYQVADMSGITL